MTNLPAYPQPSDVVFDDEGRIASNLHCWTCDYNLRTISVEATCPECGTAVVTTLQHRDGRKARPFSLYTLNWVSRTLGLIYGLAGPALVVFIAALSPMQPMNAEWQSGRVEEIVGTMLAGRAMWAFYPFLIWAYVAYGVLMFVPLKVGRQWWVRAGLWLGCVLGVQYQLVICLNLTGLSTELVGTILVGLIPLGVLAAIVSSCAASDQARVHPPRKRPSEKATAAQILFTVGTVIVGGLVSYGLVFLPALVAGPYLMLLCMGAALCRVYRTDFDERPQRSKLIPVVATGAGYTAAWPIAVTQAQIVYSSLPTQPPGCYVCSASAHGHRWLTRARPVRFGDGRVLWVTRQMQVLKAGELLLAERLPRLHRGLRAVYDRVGPSLARRIQSPWLADGSYLLFVPLAAVTRLVLVVSRRSGEIARAYQ